MIMPWYLGNSRGFMDSWWSLPGLALLGIWSVAWTGTALWHAAKRKELGWFIFFLLVHTAGIVEFVYLYFIAKIFTQSSKPPTRKAKK
jgi:hypothetical protein